MISCKNSKTINYAIHPLLQFKTLLKFVKNGLGLGYRLG